MPSDQMGRSNAEDAYQAIRQLIVTVGIPPGGAFTEGELVERTGIGKTPVREALLRLKAESLILAQPRAGYRAAPVTLKDVRDTCRTLRYLETDTSEYAADNIDVRALLHPLQDHVERGADSDERGETADGWIQADWRFHLALARSHDNQVQADIMTKLGDTVLRFRYLALALGASGRTLAHQHDDLLKAMAEADHVGASAAVSSLWQETESSLVATLSTAESVQSANVAITGDKNAFYLDAVPPGPAIPDVFQSSLRPGTRSSPPPDRTP
jgi:DNA-binding GntR family transcriptional regulator